MKITATLPDGQRQTLIDVPAYDFNWQLFYYPVERVALPRGTRVDVLAHYDNSADNRNNPDPERSVTFGEQSSDEMMFGVLEFVASDGVSPTPATPESRMDALQSTLPAEAAYRVPVTVLRPIPSVLHLPRQGEGTWYLGAESFSDQRDPDQEHRVGGRQFQVPNGRSLWPEGGVHLRRGGHRD